MMESHELAKNKQEAEESAREKQMQAAYESMCLVYGDEFKYILEGCADTAEEFGVDKDELLKELVKDKFFIKVAE